MYDRIHSEVMHAKVRRGRKVCEDVQNSCNTRDVVVHCAVDRWVARQKIFVTKFNKLHFYVKKKKSKIFTCEPCICVYGWLGVICLICCPIMLWF